MSDTYRWTLEEYVLRCEDGAGLAEVLVEGSLDRDVIADALGRWHLEHVEVIDSDFVSVDSAELRRFGLTAGVKSQLVAIALELELRATSSFVEARVGVVVDRDYDDGPSSRFLFETDGHSMESYAFAEPVLEGLLRVGFGRGPAPRGRAEKQRGNAACSATELMRRLLPAAIEVGAVRLVLRELLPPARLPDSWLGQVAVDQDGAAALDGRNLLERSVAQTNHAEELPQLDKRRGDFVPSVAGNPQRLVRGHDYVAILHKVLKSPWGRRLIGTNVRTWDQDRFVRIVFLSIPSGLLDSARMFVDLRAWLEA